MAIFEFIEGWYNPQRRHSALDYPVPHQLREESIAPELIAKAVNRPPNRGQSNFVGIAVGWANALSNGDGLVSPR